MAAANVPDGSTITVASDTAPEDAFVPRELLVRFHPDTAAQEIARLESQLGLTLLEVFETVDTQHYESETDVMTAIQILSSHPAVEFAEPNYLRERLGIPNDPLFPYQWALHNTGQETNGVQGPADIDIDWPEATDLFTGTTDIVVAVIDSGVAMDHPELSPRLWFNTSEVDCTTTCDGVDNDGNGFVDDLSGWDFVDSDNSALDENGHGTLVASIIGAAGENHEGVAGIAPTARIMALRVADDFGRIVLSVSRFIASTTYAAQNGAVIVNASFGGYSHSAAESAQIDWLNEQGVLLIAASGNGGFDGMGDDNDATPHYPASYHQDNIISVAAIDRTGDLAAFSNYGSASVDIAAPGTSIYGADLDRDSTYLETFEEGAPGWTHEHLTGSQSTLDWGLWTDGFGNTWATDSTGPSGTRIAYQSFTDSVLMSPHLTIPELGPQLSFDIHYETENQRDWLYLESSEDGINWTVVDSATGRCLECAFANGIRLRYDLSAYSGISGYLRFRLVTDESVHFDGVYVDNLELTEVATFEYDGSQYGFNQGTSFAAPIASGVAALIWSQFPGMSHHQVRNTLLQSSRTSASLEGLIDTASVVNAETALAYLFGDDDSDGLANGDEYTHDTDPGIPDTDDDGLSDGAEIQIYGTNPTRADSDDDSLDDGEEVSIHRTDPAGSDTDGDSLLDGEELRLGLDPLDPDDCPLERCPTSGILLKLVPILKRQGDI